MRDRQRPLRRLTGRVVAVAAVVGVTMLGNLRLQASEIGHPFATRAPGTGVLASHTTAPATAGAALDQVDPVPVASGRRHPDDRFTALVDDDGASDVAELVPAIYAWDKDVRFVYFRHVSKWM